MNNKNISIDSESWELNKLQNYTDFPIINIENKNEIKIIEKLERNL